jgi:WD domain, G-beta repeat
MAQVCRHRRAIAAALLGLAALAFAPALAQDQGAKDATDLYDRPVLAIDPGMHTAKINAQAVDSAGRFAVTGSDDRTVRVWSVADGKLLRTIWIPVGPGSIGAIFAVAISPDGSTIAAGGFTERITGGTVVYLFERESGNLIRRIQDDLPNVTAFLTFSPDGRYLAATLGGGGGLRVFDRNRDWSEAFRDDQYADESYGAAFAANGHLATTSYDGRIRLYRYDPANESPNFRRVGEPVRAPSGTRPFRIAYSREGERLAVGYDDVAAVDVLGPTLKRVGGQAPTDVTVSLDGISKVAWSHDGRTLFGVGGNDAQGRTLLYRWDQSGQGHERRMTYCASDTAAGIDVLPDGAILAASRAQCLALMDARGEPMWTVPSPVLDFRDQEDVMRVSEDGKVVDLGYRGSAGPVLRFDVRSLILSSPPPNDGLTFAPNREGLAIEGWLNGVNPTLNGGALSLAPYEVSESLAIAEDAKRFFLGSSFALTAFDDSGAQKWRWPSRNIVWTLNASRDGRLVVSLDSDGAIRWHRADTGGELLALQVLPNKEKDPTKWDWVLWTPEGFYEAAPGAQDVLKWVVNHGPDNAATTLPVSAIAKLHRPNALPHVIDQLETAHALGVEDITQARLDVQTATGSAKPPGGVLHVLAIGVDKFGDRAGGLHLDYAAKDAHDVAAALFDTQKGAPGKASLYADVSVIYLSNEQATHTAILDRLDEMAQSVAKGDPVQDMAVILVSSHGEMIQGKFYLIPYGFDLASPNASRTSALSVSEFAEKIAAIAAHAKVLLLLDACHSGAVGAQDWAKDPDAKVLEDTMNLKNVTVLTSSGENELSEELPEWQHGALAEAFLDALKGAADPQGIIRVYPLIDAMDNEVQSLTKGRQHLGTHPNFNGDLFMASHY